MTKRESARLVGEGDYRPPSDLLKEGKMNGWGILESFDTSESAAIYLSDYLPKYTWFCPLIKEQCHSDCVCAAKPRCTKKYLLQEFVKEFVVYSEYCGNEMFSKD